MRQSGSPRSSREQFTFQGNVRDSRYGWLRLTPAYSVHLVRELLEARRRSVLPVLDPFCGTGTTLLACRELGLPCDTVDLNPFLVWLARAKAAHYPPRDVAGARTLVAAMARAARRRSRHRPWLPPLYRIDRWWSEPAADALGRARIVLGRGDDVGRRASDLARLALCRALIETANVSFGHQSMSFRRAGQGRARPSPDAAAVSESLLRAGESIATAAASRVERVRHRVVCADARALDRALGDRRYGTVVTSPPYPNRMSYIRELRPYMYWLGYLADRTSAGELDWRLIGGTWGSATSRLQGWEPDPHVTVPLPGFDRIANRIADRSEILSRYVVRYFQDMHAHVASLRRVLARGARLYYVVGNSKFYDVLLPAEQIFAALFEDAGLREVEVRALRKRTSKTELFEYLVSAKRP